MHESSSAAAEEPMVQREERSSGGGERQIQLHPLVLMNVADHFTRERRGCAPGATPPQVIGALFGVQSGLDVAVYDSFELKYDVVGGDVQLDKEFVNSRIQQCAFLVLLVMMVLVVLR